MDSISNVRIWVENVEDVIEFEDNLHNIGYYWSGWQKYLIRNGDVSKTPKTFIFDLESQHFDAYRYYNDSGAAYDDEPTDNIKMLEYPKDKQKIINFLKHKSFIPTYEPRKIIKESNIIYPYRFKTEEEMIRDYGENWRDEAFLGDNIGWNPEMDKFLGKVLEKTKDQLNFDNKYEACSLYDGDDGDDGDSWLIDWDMLTKLKLEPDYKPRKIDRTYESYYLDNNEINIHSKDNMPMFLIGDKVKFKKDSKPHEDLADIYGPIGYTYKDFFDKYKDGQFNIEEKYFDDVNNLWWSYLKVIGDEEESFSKYQSYFLDKSLESVIPSYKPRKILKESTKNIFYYPPKTLNVEEQKEMFEIGDEVYIRPDAFDYYLDFDEYVMPEMLGEKGKIIKIITIGGVYGNYIGDYEWAFPNDVLESVNPGDLLIRVETSDVRSRTKHWYYKCLVSTKNIKPTYKPKKMIKEDRNSINEAEEIAIIINNEDELGIIKDIFKNNNITVNSDVIELVLSQLYDGKGSVIFYNIIDDGFMYCKLDYLKGVGVYASEFNKVWENILTVNDLRLIDSIIKNKKINFAPTYKPRQIIKESMGNNKEYGEFIVEVNSLDDVHDIKKYFPTYEYLIGDDRLGIYPNWVFVNSYEEELTIWSYKPEQEKIDSYIKRTTNKIYNKIFNINQLSLIKKFIEYGVLYPDYKPKNVKRIYEDLNYEFKEIVIKINNESEYITFKSFLENLNSSYWLMGVGNIDVFPNYLFLKVDDYHKTNHLHGIILTDDPDDDMEDLINDFIYNDDMVNNKIFTINDLSSIKNILFYGKERIPPSYKPRNIIKESSNNIDYVFKTIEELENEYGDNWRSAIGANSHGEMDYLYDGSVLDYNKIDKSEQLDNFEELKNYLEDGNDIHYNNWYIDKKSLKIKRIKPSYEPKKISRLNESSSYFYRVKTEEELEEEFGEEWGYIIDDKYMWNSEYMDYLLGQKIDITEEEVEDAKNNTLYVTVPNDPELSGLDIREQEDWFVSVKLLTKELLRPSYLPKKISKLNESTTFFYRVKSEKELKGEFGEYWENKLDTDYLWNDDYMNYLFGKNLDITEEDIKNNYHIRQDKKYIKIPNDPELSGTSNLDYWFINIDLITKVSLNPSYKPKTIKR